MGAFPRAACRGARILIARCGRTGRLDGSGRRMDFAVDARTGELQDELTAFLAACVYPAEPVFAAQVAELTDPWAEPPVVADLRREARGRGLWNLFLPDPVLGAGLTNLQYAPLAEI